MNIMPEEKTDNLIHLTIDDTPVAVPPGTLVWAAAKQAGIEIPIYCYHPKMPPLGARRMCFVEIEKVPLAHCRIRREVADQIWQYGYTV